MSYEIYTELVSNLANEIWPRLVSTYPELMDDGFGIVDWCWRVTQELENTYQDKQQLQHIGIH